MGSKTRLSSYCTKRANNTVNLVTSRKINARLARPIEGKIKEKSSDEKVKEIHEKPSQSGKRQGKVKENKVVLQVT